MILATTQVEDFDRFLAIFSTKGAEKRRQHGSKGATVFRDPNEADRVWVLFDWDADGWQRFVSDPEGPQGQAAGGGARRRVRRVVVLWLEERPSARVVAPPDVEVITPDAR